jgi:hypothetical protein
VLKGSEIKDFIFYLIHRKLVLSRGTHQKSLGKGQGVYHSKFSISNLHHTCPMNPLESRGNVPDSRESHRACPVVAPDLSCLGLDSRAFSAKLQRASPDLSGGGTRLIWSTGLVRSGTSFHSLYAGLVQ